MSKCPQTKKDAEKYHHQLGEIHSCGQQTMLANQETPEKLGRVFSKKKTCQNRDVDPLRLSLINLSVSEFLLKG